ncbi:MAG: response regulator [Candidatus Eremiobacteraeota bacterium]|nr:response regulator [Candidatus Eremiobacteraeota bacterium]
MNDLAARYPTSTEISLGRILVVDDNPISRTVLDRVLQAGFHSTHTATDGNQAWDMVMRGEVDLVVADFRMPGMNGFELCQRIKTHPDYHLIPVIIVTAADDVASRISAFEHGADDILPKPVINEELLARVRNLIRFSELVNQQLEMELSKANLQRELAIAKLNQEQEETRNRLYHDVLFAATGGTLQLMEPTTLAEHLEGWTEVTSLELADNSQIAETRRLTEELALKCGMGEECIGDVVLCVSEAVTNALKFGKKVHFRCGLHNGHIQLYVQDDGPGLEHSMLPQVTLQKGFSTHSSLGMGFSLMLETMDKVGLCTGSSGTAVLLSKQCVVDDELELDRFLDRFSVTLD